MPGPHHRAIGAALTLGAALSLALAPLAAHGHQPVCPLLDPVTTHTNGMGLASSDPLRSHHYGWKCDPYHNGPCGGRYNIPCLNSLVAPNCLCAQRGPLPTGEPCPRGCIEGLEQTTFERVGQVPSTPLGPGAEAP